MNHQAQTKKPTLFAVMLREQPLNTVGGALFFLGGGYALLTYKPLTDPAAPYTSFADTFNLPIFWLTCVMGAGSLARAWWTARSLRDGR